MLSGRYSCTKPAFHFYARLTRRRVLQRVAVEGGAALASRRIEPTLISLLTKLALLQPLPER